MIHKSLLLLGMLSSAFILQAENLDELMYSINHIDKDHQYEKLINYVTREERATALIPVLHGQLETLIAHRAYYLENLKKMDGAILMASGGFAITLAGIFKQHKSPYFFASLGWIGFTVAELLTNNFLTEDLPITRIKTLLDILAEKMI